MDDGCESCGAQLFAGQQFCRRCGAPVRPQGDEAATQILGPPAASATSQLPGPGTAPVFPPRPAAHQARFGQAPAPAPAAASARAANRS